MDKRKVIILAIVLFLFIGLGTFVFAQSGSDENGNGQGNNTIEAPDNNGGDNGQDTPSGTEDDGETEEGGNTGTDNTTTAGGNGGENEQPGEEPNTPNEPETPENPDTPVDNTKAELLAALKAIQEKIDNADALDDIDSARVDRTDELVSAVEELDDAELNDLLDEINRVLDDSTKPLITPEDLDGSYNNATVAITISDDTATNYTLTLNGDPVENPDLDELTEEGTYTLTVTDEAFNEVTVTFTIDKTNPVLLVNGSKVENDDVIYVNKDAKMTVDEDNLESFTSNDIDISEALINNGYWTAQKDGEYNIEVTDKAGNTTTYKVVVDKTPIAVNHLYVLNNTHNDYNVSEENRYKVVGNGQELYFEYVLKEEFTSTPKLTIGGKEYKMTCDVASWNDELYKCDAHVTISEDMNLTNGEEIPFTITGVKDEAQNETIVTEKDVTVTDKYGQVVYDNSAPESNWVYILNTLEGSHTVIGNEQKLLVEINVNEELLTNPVLKIGEYSVELERRANDSRYIYTKVVTIDADTMNLTHNEEIKFTVDITDVAGKTTTLDNDDVTIHKKEGYGQVVYDNVAPVYEALGILNVTHLRLNNADENANESLTVANIGDEVRVLVRFDEKLDTLPTLVIGDASAEMTLMKSSAEYTYSADITLTADMFDEDGLVDFQVSGYADIAGNEGDKLNASHIKGYADYSGVTLDTTKPLMTINGESNITLKAGDTYDELGVTVEDAVDGTKVLDPVRINYSIDGEFQGTVPAVDPTKPGTYKVVYEYTDAAGNVGVDADRQDHDFIIRTVTVEKIETYFEFMEPDSNVYDGNEKEFEMVLKDQFGNILDKETINIAVKDENNELADLIDAGDYTITAHYAGSNNYKATYLYEEYVIEQAATEIILTYPDSLVADGIPKVFKAELWDVTNDKLVKELTPVYEDANGNRGAAINAGEYILIVHSGYMDNYKSSYIRESFEILPEGTTSLVNGVSYETLKDAVDAAKVNGGTVELVADVVNSSKIGIANNQEVTIDLNGNDISFASNQYFAVSGGTLTLTGEGTVKESDPYYGPILIKRSFIQGRPLTINVDEEVTLEGSSGIFVDYSAARAAMNTTINLKGNINSVRDRAGSVGYAIYVQGKINNTNNYPVINIYEGSEINSVGMGIYAAGYAEWNIYGGIINAKETAIGIKSGKLNISGGTFTANGEENIPTPAWGNGMIGSGSALQIESNDGYAQGMEINISGGEFISENAATIYEYPADATTSVIDFTITGGTFKSTNYSSNFVFSQSFTKTHQGFMSNITFDKENSVLDSYLAEGYILEEQADGIYKVVKG